jgi:hypothetical protein
MAGGAGGLVSIEKELGGRGVAYVLLCRRVGVACRAYLAFLDIISFQHFFFGVEMGV